MGWWSLYIRHFFVGWAVCICFWFFLMSLGKLQKSQAKSSLISSHNERQNLKEASFVQIRSGKGLEKNNGRQQRQF